MSDRSGVLEKGVYSLILYTSKDTTLKIGDFGIHRFPKGYYVYTGSALGKGASSLGGRVARHLIKKKKLFWHIDYLLSSQNVAIKTVIFTPTNKRLECKINECIKGKGTVPITNFGASDCKGNCGSHLMYLGKRAGSFGALIFSCHLKEVRERS